MNTYLQNIYKKSIKSILAFTIAFSSLGLMKVQEASAATIGGNWSKYANMDSRNKKVAQAAGVHSDATNINSSYNVKTEGTKNPSAYQWTAWYNRYIKDFTINKSKTSGTYRNGFPKKTSSASTSTNFNKIGFFKYLRDPIYSNITMKATQTFNYKRKVKVGTKTQSGETIPPLNLYDTTGFAKEPPAGASSQTNWQWIKRSINDEIARKGHPKKYRINDSDAKEIERKLKNSFKYTDDYEGGLGYKWTMEAHNVNLGQKSDGYTYKLSVSSRGVDETHADRVIVIYTKTKTVPVYETRSYTKSVEIAKTKIASNVSATELHKFKNFSLQWKGGGTAKKNTTIGKKSSAGWWRQHNPPYHGGTRTTSDTGGGAHYYTFSTSGTYGITRNLYNMITEKERIFTQQSKTSTPIANYKYKLTINPNGGEYLNSTANKTVTSPMNSSTTVYKPYRKGYLFTGWKHVGEGTWDAVSARFTFTGDSTLTAQWIKNNGPGPEGNSNKPTPPGGDRDPGTPTNPPNPGCDGDGCQPGVTPDGNRKEYTLTIDPNGGKYNYSTKVSKVTKQAGSYTSINPPRRSGYIFDGWQVVEGNSSYLSQGKYTKPSTYVFYGNARIKAKWLRNNSQNGTLVVDPNGGVYEGSTNKKTYTAKSGYFLAVRNPTRDGYQFVGWNIDTNNDVNGIFDTSSNSFMFKRGKSTLKARWKKFVPDNCIIDGTGPNACPEMDIVLPKFIHLTKNPGEWDD